MSDAKWREAWREGVDVQRQFDAGCLEIGRRALEFCVAQNIVPIVVLGRAYTIYNKVLNSNVPAILREQGAIGIPLDCYPLDAGIPVFADDHRLASVVRDGRPRRSPVDPRQRR